MTNSRAMALPRAIVRRRALILVLAGCPGILSLQLGLPEMPGVPFELLLLQPTLLLIVSAFAGSWFAARSSLRLAAGLHPAERAKHVAIGILLGLAIAMADHLSRVLWQSAPGAPPSILETWDPAKGLVGLLYGGVVEEVIFRWCIMSFFSVALSWAIPRGTLRSKSWIMPISVFISALLFAVSHIPGLGATGSSLSVGPVLRTLLLNGVAGMLFGFLFARHDLLAAMQVHGSTHVGFAAAALLWR